MRRDRTASDVIRRHREGTAVVRRSIERSKEIPVIEHLSRSLRLD